MAIKLSPRTALECGLEILVDTLAARLRPHVGPEVDLVEIRKVLDLFTRHTLDYGKKLGLSASVVPNFIKLKELAGDSPHNRTRITRRRVESALRMMVEILDELRASQALKDLDQLIHHFERGLQATSPVPEFEASHLPNRSIPAPERELQPTVQNKKKRGLDHTQSDFVKIESTALPSAIEDRSGQKLQTVDQHFVKLQLAADCAEGWPEDTWSQSLENDDDLEDQDESPIVFDDQSDPKGRETETPVDLMIRRYYELKWTITDDTFSDGFRQVNYLGELFPSSSSELEQAISSTDVTKISDLAPPLIAAMEYEIDVRNRDKEVFRIKMNELLQRHFSS